MATEELPDVLPLLESAPFFGIGPIPRTRLRDWAYLGVQGQSGRIRLKTVKVVGRRYVRRADAEAFLAATSAPTPEPAPKPSRAQQAADRRRLREAREFIHS